MAFLGRLKKIKLKIILIVLITSMITVAIGQIISLYYNISIAKEQLSNRTIMNARLIGEYCVAPLTFNDIAGVDDVLAKLQSLPEIEHVFIYNDQNELVTSYNHIDSLGAQTVPDIEMNPESSGFTGEEFHVSMPIIYDNFNYGSIYIIASTKVITESLEENLIMLAVLFLVLIILSYFLAGQFQKAISGPIVQLTNTIRSVSEEGDYSVRVIKNTNDEIGMLYDDFNNMLEQVQNREKAKALADEIIKRERDRAKNYLDVANVIIMALDTQANIIQINRKGCEILEVTEEEVVGKNWYDLFVIEDRKEKGRQAFKEIITDRIVDYDLAEGIVVTSKGKERLIAWRDVLLTDKDGTILGILSSGEDITEKKYKDMLIQASNDKLNSVIENSPVGIYHFNVNSEITMCNKAICDLYNVTAEKLIGHNLLNETNEPGIVSAIIQSLEGEQALFEGVYTSSFKQNKLQVKAVFTPLFDKDHKITGGMCMVEDISERLRMEKMQRDRDAAEASNKAKSEFLARMSHEIRTPMNAIIGLSHLCLKTKLNDQQDDYVQKINNSGKHLLGIINDILDYSKIEAGKLSIERVSFSFEKSLHDLSSLITMKAQEKGLEFMFVIDQDVPYNLIGDSLRLSQVLTNLANNSVKFTDKGEIVLRVSVVNRAKKTVELKFVVEDTGIGMNENQRVNLFQSFSQADISTSRKYGGTGLGLAISKRLVQLMGGDIWVESELGKGSKFIFTAIFGTEPASDELPEVVVEGIRVLACDDNPTNLQFISLTMEIFQFDVVGVLSGSDAIKKLEESNDNPFNLVIMDWMMPEMDGLTAIQKIKENPKIKQKPAFIMLTAYGRDKKMLKQAKGLNLEGFLEKPVTRSTLFDAIMTALGQEKIIGRKGLVEEVIPKELDNIIGSKILLAEDNEINQQVATELLESVGFEMEIANNGEEAVEMVQKSGVPSKYDIVLMDLQMPIMDGYTATINILEMEQYSNLPIVAMTADAMAGVADKCREIGMKDFITKPISPEKVYATLIRWIKPKNLSKDEIEAKKEILKSKKEKTDKVDIPEFMTLITSEGMRRMGGNADAYLKLLKRFHNNNQQFGSLALNLYKEGDHEQLHRVIHTLKGVSGNIGAKKLHNVVIEVEKEMLNNDEYEIKSLLDRIIEELNPVLYEIEIQIIDKVVEEEKPDADTPIDKVKVLSLLLEIETLLNESDAQAIDIVVELGKVAGHIDHFEEIKEALNQYDFEEALDAVIKMKEII